MRILLIDADSKIPNLALMRISTYHKRMGDVVELVKLGIKYYPSNKLHNIDVSGYDKVYCSAIFTTTPERLRLLGDLSKVDFGGTGYSITKKLPKELDSMEPDYSIYPENNTSYGFLSRGCIRNCSFCFVPEKEGDLEQVANVDDIVQHKKVEFLDNNFLALPNHAVILEELVTKKIKCCFKQGLDIRLLTGDNQELLGRINYIGEYIFAFDDISYKKLIDSKLPLIHKFGEWRCKFFIYIHPDMAIADTIFRVEYCRKYKVLPYIMRDLKCWSSEQRRFYVDLAAYCNQPSLFKKMSFGEFLDKRYTNQDRIQYSLRIWTENI